MFPPFVFFISCFYIIPPIMLGSIAGAGAAGSGLLATTASVVKIKLATDAAFCRAERLTLTGSIIP